MAEQRAPMTSDALGQCLGANPVVVRRTMGLLREAGLVAAGRGRDGGWTITADLAAVTLRDLHEALGEPAVFAVGHRSENPGCLVEQVVNAALNDAFDEAEALLLERFASVSLAQLAKEFSRRHKAHKARARRTAA